MAECNRCRVGGRGKEADVQALIVGVSRLAPMERAMLSDWIDADQREFGTVERYWADYRTLPAESREKVRKALSD